MESARRYASVKYATTSYRAGSAGIGSDGQNLFAGLLPDSQSFQNQTLNKKGDAKADYLKNVTDQFRSFQNTQKVSESEQTREQSSAKIEFKQQCIMHLLRFLHGIIYGRNYEGMPVEITADGGSQFTSQFSPLRVLETREYYEEFEETSFSTTGCVVTEDGREIDFQLELTMSRSFSAYLGSRVQYLDPLVINLDTDMASIEDQKFYFDLDTDGELEQIASLSAGSGFLALDQNGNGKIDDGSELFGAASGDGFADLSKYDLDGNGFIDENDPIWEKLLIWTKDEAGNDELYQLCDKGVGALCLSKVETQFSLTGTSQNAAGAVIRSTGFFLYEDGRAGTLQHLDMAT